jgi:hypothetical protein
MFSSLKREPPIGAFWKWFEQNRSLIEEPVGDDRAIFKDLHHNLRRINPHLSYDIRGSKPKTLIISADGEPEMIDLVHKVVDAAPSLPGWQVTPFRPPLDQPAVIVFQDRDLTVDSVLFAIDEERPDETFDIRVFIPGVTEDNIRHLGHCAILLIESMIGEYAVMTLIHEVEYVDPEHEEDDGDRRPLRDLPRALRIFPEPQTLQNAG